MQIVIAIKTETHHYQNCPSRNALQSKLLHKLNDFVIDQCVSINGPHVVQMIEIFVRNTDLLNHVWQSSGQLVNVLKTTITIAIVVIRVSLLTKPCNSSSHLSLY